MARYRGPLTPEQADQIREVIDARLPGWNVLIVDDRWTFTTDQPEPEHRRTNP